MQALICIGCERSKPLEAYPKDSRRKYGVQTRCKQCQDVAQNISRKQNNYRNSKKYEKTKKGFVVRTYRNMLSRVRGIVKGKRHLYEGLSIMDKKAFYEFSLQDDNFKELFSNWVNSNYSVEVSPSIDRVNPEEGYVITNIRWVTHSFNSANTRRWK